jgi:hypothetical protein
MPQLTVKIRETAPGMCQTATTLDAADRRRHVLGMPDRSSTRPRDANQLAKLMVDIATGNRADVTAEVEKNPAAVALGRLGGLKGGNARAASLSADQRKQVAQRAAKARWGDKPKDGS